MANFSGIDTKLQVGLESAYGTAVTPTKQLEYLSTSLQEIHNTVESTALVGAVTTPFFSIIGRKVEGDVAIEVHPDNMGLLLSAALGVEADAALVSPATDAYVHALTPISGGDSLPSVTVKVDKKDDVYVYSGLKIDSFTLESDPSSLLTSTISFIGQKEVGGGSLATLSNSSHLPFDFTDMSIFYGTAGAEATTAFPGITSFSFSYANNLENDLFTASGTEYMDEIDYQMRTISLSMDVLNSDAISALRAAHYTTGEPLSLKVVFTHPDSIATSSVKYSIILDLRNVALTEAPNTVDGPERLKISMSFKALEVGSDPAITINVRDASATEYLG